MASQHPSSSSPCDPGRDDPPYKHECEIIYDEGPDEKLRWEGCNKNPFHPTFIPVKEFKMADLPPEHQTEKMMKIIKYHSDLTVKITLKYISLKRPNTYPNSTAPYPASDCKGRTDLTWAGTGSFFRCREPCVVKQVCPCPECKQSGKPKTEFYVMFVRTALHVIFDGSETDGAVVELFFDSEDKKGVERLYGVKELNPDDTLFSGDDKELAKKCKSDYFYLRCVTHDRKLFEVVRGLFWDPELFFPYTETESSLSFIISHPHGRCKHITIGNVVRFSYPIHLSHPAYTMFTINKGTECRFIENKNANENSSASLIESESFQSLVNSDVPCTPGVIYILNNSIKLSLPYGSTDFCESVFTQGDSDVLQQRVRWVRFPAGTRFVNGNGDDSGTATDSSLLPVMMEFKVDMTNYLDCFDSSLFRYSYDVDTCPGSSGAAVYLMGYTTESQGWIFHAGAHKSRMNRSGIYPLYFDK